MLGSLRDKWLAYGIAVTSVAIALGVRLQFASVVGDRTPFETFFIAVALTAWFGGYGPCLVATALGAIAAWYFILPPEYSFRLTDPYQIFGLVAFVITGSVLAVFSGRALKLLQERVRLLENERSARSDTERSMRVKDDFLSTLSHELRTPLQSILGWVEVLKLQPSDPARLAKGLDAIERGCRAQKQLVDDLLDMSRIESGKLRLNVRMVEVAPVIDAAIESALPAAQVKEISIHKVLDPLVGSVKGDPDRLQQVVSNLLSNAVKFTPKGGKIEVRLGRVGSFCEIMVSDTGCGIKPDFLPFVFDRFRQHDSSFTRMQVGLGLGLAIVKQLVEHHNGSVAAQSPGEGRGSTFTVRLPIATAVESEPAPSLVHDGQRVSECLVPNQHMSLGSRLP